MSIQSLTFSHTIAWSERRSHYVVVVAAVLAAAACGSTGYGGGGAGGPTDPGTPPGAPVSTATVQATPAMQFTPRTVELNTGGTVTFEFGTLEHNLFFDNAPPGAPANVTAPTRNQTVTRTFSTAGRFTYNCHIHPGMSGTIDVH